MAELHNPEFVFLRSDQMKDSSQEAAPDPNTQWHEKSGRNLVQKLLSLATWLKLNATEPPFAEPDHFGPASEEFPEGRRSSSHKAVKQMLFETDAGTSTRHR